MKHERGTYAKTWCATLYNCTIDQIREIAQRNATKAVFQKEKCPKTGREHIQGVFAFNRRLRAKQAKDIFGDFRPHVEPARSWKASVAYCSKDDSRVGDTVFIGEDKTRDDTIREHIERGDINTVRRDYYGYFIRYRRALFEDLVSQYKPRTMEHTRGVWVHGRTGVGKTREIANLPNLYWKGINKWWDGYTCEQYVVMDDVDQKIWNWGIQYIKRWTDHYQVTGETKGGHINLNHEWFIITSNESLDESMNYLEANHKDAVKRRFIEINANKEGWKDIFGATLRPQKGPL